jgi:hypothetical protein
MRTQLTKITLTAGIALATAFTFNACGGSDDDTPPPMKTSSSSIGSSSSNISSGNSKWCSVPDPDRPQEIICAEIGKAIPLPTPDTQAGEIFTEEICQHYNGTLSETKPQNCSFTITEGSGHKTGKTASCLFDYGESKICMKTYLEDGDNAGNVGDDCHGGILVESCPDNPGQTCFMVLQIYVERDMDWILYGNYATAGWSCEYWAEINPNNPPRRLR